VAASGDQNQTEPGQMLSSSMLLLNLILLSDVPFSTPTGNSTVSQFFGSIRAMAIFCQQLLGWAANGFEYFVSGQEIPMRSYCIFRFVLHHPATWSAAAIAIVAHSSASYAARRFSMT